MAYIAINHTEKSLTIAHTEYEGRKSRPNLRQKSAEEMVQKVHDSVKKISSYLGTHLVLDPIDYYDEGYDHYEVPGASIKKGERKAKNASWEKTSIPKTWEKELRVTFGEVTQITKPIVESVKAMGYTLSDANVKAIKALLAEKTPAFVNITENNSFSYHSFRSSTSITLEVSDTSNEE